MSMQAVPANAAIISCSGLHKARSLNLPVPHSEVPASRRYGQAHTEAKRAGTPFGDADLWFGSISFAPSLPFATRNPRQFQAVPFLFAESCMGE